MGLAPHEVARRGIARTFQHIRLFGQMTVLENVMVGRDFKGRTGIFSALLRPPRVGAKKRKTGRNAWRCLPSSGSAFCPVWTSRPRPCPMRTAGGGDRPGAGVRPQLLLLDEPTAGMNPHETQQVVELIRLMRDRGHTFW